MLNLNRANFFQTKIRCLIFAGILACFLSTSSYSEIIYGDGLKMVGAYIGFLMQTSDAVKKMESDKNFVIVIRKKKSIQENLAIPRDQEELMNELGASIISANASAANAKRLGKPAGTPIFIIEMDPRLSPQSKNQLAYIAPELGALARNLIGTADLLYKDKALVALWKNDKLSDLDRVNLQIKSSQATIDYIKNNITTIKKRFRNTPQELEGLTAIAEDLETNFLPEEQKRLARWNTIKKKLEKARLTQPKNKFGSLLGPIESQHHVITVIDSEPPEIYGSSHR